MLRLNVAKFGGTSVANFAAMQRCAQVVINNPNTRIVVVSASAGVTNLLVRLAIGGHSELARNELIEQIQEIEFALLNSLDKPDVIRNELMLLLEQLGQAAADPDLAHSLRLKDQLLSFGERMSSLIFTQVLNQCGDLHALNFDVREVIKTNSQHGGAKPNTALIKTQAEELMTSLLSEHVLVTQGFIGSDELNNTTTLGRGGSDYSAAILAEALSAETLHIWTDVSGIFTTDPRIASGARPIPELTFDEAAEMATFGAKILHPATLIPAIRSDIKVFVGSSREPELGGTWISKEVENKPAFRAIALRREQVLVTLKSPDMLHATGFLASVFSLLAQHEISVDLITTSEISVALTIDEPQNGTSKKLSKDLIEKLEALCEVKIEDDLSLVAVIGNQLQSREGVASKILSVMPSCNVRMICHGASSNNFCFLVNGKEAEGIVESLHKTLFETA